MKLTLFFVLSVTTVTAQYSKKNLSPSSALNYFSGLLGSEGACVPLLDIFKNPNRSLLTIESTIGQKDFRSNPMTDLFLGIQSFRSKYPIPGGSSWESDLGEFFLLENDSTSNALPRVMFFAPQTQANLDQNLLYKFHVGCEPEGFVQGLNYRKALPKGSFIEKALLPKLWALSVSDEITNSTTGPMMKGLLNKFDICVDIYDAANMSTQKQNEMLKKTKTLLDDGWLTTPSRPMIRDLMLRRGLRTTGGFASFTGGFTPKAYVFYPPASEDWILSSWDFYVGCNTVGQKAQITGSPSVDRLYISPYFLGWFTLKL